MGCAFGMCGVRGVRGIAEILIERFAAFLRFCSVRVGGRYQTHKPYFGACFAAGRATKSDQIERAWLVFFMSFSCCWCRCCRCHRSNSVGIHVSHAKPFI